MGLAISGLKHASQACSSSIATTDSDAPDITGSAWAISSALIPDLPNDITLPILALLPLSAQLRLRSVNKAWSEALSSPELFAQRKERGMLQERLLILSRPQRLPGRMQLKLQVVDPTTGQTEYIESCPPLGGQYGSWGRWVVAEIIDHYVVVLAGFKLGARACSSSQVLVYNLLKRTWKKGRGMNTPRAGFACAVLGNRIYVAGGWGSAWEHLRSAEVYDLATDEWTTLPSMSRHRYGCAGVALNGRFWVIGGTEILPSGRLKLHSSAEVFDPVAGSWSLVENMWPSLGSVTSVVVVNGRDWAGKVLCYRSDRAVFSCRGSFEMVPVGGLTPLGGRQRLLALQQGKKIVQYDEGTNTWRKCCQLPVHDHNSKLVALRGGLLVLTKAGAYCVGFRQIRAGWFVWLVVEYMAWEAGRRKRKSVLDCVDRMVCTLAVNL